MKDTRDTLESPIGCPVYGLGCSHGNRACGPQSSSVLGAIFKTHVGDISSVPYCWCPRTNEQAELWDKWLNFHLVLQGTFVLRGISSLPLREYHALMATSLGLERFACKWPVTNNHLYNCNRCLSRAKKS